MQLRQIASISGKPGLFRILKPMQNGVLVETIEASPKKMPAGATSKVSILSEISIYTTDAEGSVPLAEVLKTIHKDNKGKPLALNAKSDGADLEKLLSDTLPDWDKDRVYTSDIKKLVTWYNILCQHAQDVFKEEEQETEEKLEKETKVASKKDKQDKEPAKAKATAKADETEAPKEKAVKATKAAEGATEDKSAAKPKATKEESSAPAEKKPRKKKEEPEA